MIRIGGQEYPTRTDTNCPGWMLMLTDRAELYERAAATARHLEIRREGERMERYLTELAVEFGLQKHQVDLIYKIVEADGKGFAVDSWVTRFTLRMLCLEIKQGLLPEDLGYAEEKK